MERKIGELCVALSACILLLSLSHATFTLAETGVKLLTGLQYNRGICEKISNIQE